MTDYVGDEQELVDRQTDARRTQLNQIASVYYFHAAFDKHASGLSHDEAEKAAQNICYQVLGDNNIAFPAVPWDKYESFAGVTFKAVVLDSNPMRFRKVSEGESII